MPPRVYGRRLARGTGAHTRFASPETEERREETVDRNEDEELQQEEKKSSRRDGRRAGSLVDESRGTENKSRTRRARRVAENGNEKEAGVDEELADLQDGLRTLGLEEAKGRDDVVEEFHAKAKDGDLPPKKKADKRRVATAVVVQRLSEPLPLEEDVVFVEERGTRRHGIEQRKGGKDDVAQDDEANSEDKDLENQRRNKKKNGKANPRRTKNEKTRPIVDAESNGESEAEQTAKLLAAITLKETKETEGQTVDVEPPSTPLGPVAGKNCLPRPSPAMTPADDEDYHYVSSLLARSDQRRIVPFDEWAAKLDEFVDIAKIAEASFSEVYRLTAHTHQLCANDSVLKVVALKSIPGAPLPCDSLSNQHSKRGQGLERQRERERIEREVQDEWKSKVEDVVSEVKLLQNLNHIPGFTIFRELTVMQGRPSASFGRAWKSWNKTRPKGKKSEFPDPSKKGSYEESQLWAVIEMQDAGTDCGKVMEAGGISNIWEVWDVFWGVCLSVAKAEEGCRFEHRDLHMDNICIRSSTSDVDLTSRQVQNPLKRKLGFTGLETTVIDYTLSRADILKFSPNNSPRSCISSSSTSSSSSASPCPEPEAEHEVAYLDLNKDPALFEGNAEDEYQYEIYRYMRGAVLHNDPLHPISPHPDPSDEQHHDPTPETPRRSPRKHNTTTKPPSTPLPSDHKPPQTHPWRSFHPKTNLIWTHFILHTLLQNLTTSVSPSSADADPVLENIADAHKDDIPRIQSKANKMLKILRKVDALLRPEALSTGSRLGAVRDLVLVALEARWLGEGDVRGE